MRYVGDGDSLHIGTSSKPATWAAVRLASSCDRPASRKVAMAAKARRLMRETRHEKIASGTAAERAPAVNRGENGRGPVDRTGRLRSQAARTARRRRRIAPVIAKPPIIKAQLIGSG